VALAINQSLLVRAVTSVDIIELERTAGVATTEIDITAPSVVAAPTILHATSFDSATRTTNASGVATFSWADTEGTSGKDTVTSDGATGGSTTAVHYRLATAADQSSTDANGAIADSEVAMSLVEFDAVGKDFIVEVETGLALNSVKSYMQFTYDANDQFGTGGASGAATLSGTAATEAAWVTRMATLCATACATGGVRNDVVYVSGWTGLSTAIVRYATD
jgi:23S rRNA U2552 (ribose-2'-O)-methylase RlmE/FtsJ